MKFLVFGGVLALVSLSWFGVAHAGLFGDIFGSEIAKRVGAFAGSTALSFGMGYVQKHKTDMGNKHIPERNAAMMGVGQGMIGGDPLNIGLSILGAFAASGIQQLNKRAKGR